MTYQLKNWIFQAAALESKLEESGGEITQELDEAITIRDLNLPDKVDYAKYLIDRLETISDEWAARAAKAKKIAQALAEAREKLRSGIREAMIYTAQSEVRGHDHRFVVTLGKPRLVIDEDELPGEWTKPEVTLKPDKEKITEALKRGETIPGVRFEESYQLRTYVTKRD